MASLRESLLGLPEDEFKAEVIKLLGTSANPVFVKDNLFKKTPHQLEQLLVDLGEADVNLHAGITAKIPDLNFVSQANRVLESHQKLRTLVLQLLNEPNNI